MKIHSYFTSGGKDLIREYLDSLTCSERAEGYFILEMLELKGISYLDTLNTTNDYPMVPGTTRIMSKHAWQVEILVGRVSVA